MKGAKTFLIFTEDSSEKVQTVLESPKKVYLQSNQSTRVVFLLLSYTLVDTNSISADSS